MPKGDGRGPCWGQSRWFCRRRMRGRYFGREMEFRGLHLTKKMNWKI